MHVAVQDVYTYICTYNYYQDKIKCPKSKHEFKAEMVILTVLCLYQFSICISNILSCPGNTHVHIIHTHTHTHRHTYIHTCNYTYTCTSVFVFFLFFLRWRGQQQRSVSRTPCKPRRIPHLFLLEEGRDPP